MSLGSRVFRRGRPKLITYSGLPSTPYREPLLFLYPRWFGTTASNAQSQVVDIGNTTLPSGLDQVFHNEPNLDPLFTPGNETLNFPDRKQDSENEKRSAPKGQDAFSTRASMVQSEDGYTERNDQLLRGGEKTGLKLEAKGNTSTVPSSGLIRRILAVKEKRIAQRNYERRTREAYEEIKVSERLTSEIDWRDILATLERRTPNGASQEQENEVKIKVPCKAVGRLLYGEEDNIWAIKMRCGCQIEVEEAKEGQDHRILLLTGPVDNISKAVGEVLQIAHGATSEQTTRDQRTYVFSTKSQKPRRGVVPGTNSVDVIRYVRSNERDRMAAPVRADKVPRPSFWTQESFGLYVQHLTSIEMTTQIQRTLYKPGEYHIETVIKILQALFVDPLCRKAITASAFNEALAYLEKHNAIDVVRDLFVLMEMQNLRMNTETFNIMLRGTAKSRSLGNFQQIFLLMLRRGYTPNADTWIAFLRVVDDFGIKSHILKSMKGKELLHEPRIQKHVCETFVEMEINNALDNKLSQQLFLEYMADRYGEEWLSKACASRILDALGIRGLVSRCWDFIEYMNAQNLKPTDVDIETILHHCEKQRNPEGAIEVIRRISHLINFDASQEVYRTIFSIAWTNFLPCVARVVWCHACLNGATTPRMRSRLHTGAERGLSARSSMGGANSSKQWKEIASIFVLGLDNSNNNKANTTIQNWDSSVIVPSVQPRTSESNITTDRDKEISKGIVVKALNMQMQAFRSWAQRVQFADLLVDAFKTDLEWTASGARYTEGCLAWLAERTPIVPLRQLKNSRTAAQGLKKR